VLASSVAACFFHSSLGFSEDIATLVESHAAAKRYLVATSPPYHQNLSPASQKTLILQGGSMEPEELQAFQSNALAAEMLAVRLSDDEGKVKGWQVMEGKKAPNQDLH
jgi:predicted HD phosphohydrolase